MTQDFLNQDDATREVIRTALRETLFVEAGAGTGKTRALVDRIVALVVDGRPLERIAAITFTERAAAELRDRVRQGLEGELAMAHEKASLLQTALESLDRAQISTIHAFCQALLRAYAAEAGVDPDFAVQDEVMTGRRRQERWRRYLEDLVSQPGAAAAIDRVLGLGLTNGDLEKLALDLAARADLAERLEREQLRASEPRWPDLRALRDKLEGTGYRFVSAEDKLRERIAGMVGAIDAVLARTPEDQETQLAAFCGSFESELKGVQKNWGGKDAKDAACEIADPARAVLRELLAALRSAALAGVMPFVVDFVRGDEKERGREGALTFDDLILIVRNLLERSDAARDSLRERYDALLIDEFQDTDPLQVDIALAFATDPATGDIDPGRLFLVGDPKQSIYRFRRADMAVYADTRSRIEAASARCPVLALNRRSRDVILGWVNPVFDSAIGPGLDLETQPAYRPIHPHRNDDLDGPGAAYIGGLMPDMKARDVRVLEAEKLAALCRQAIERDRWHVAERDGARRPATYRDIAILIPRRIGLTALERALVEQRVPYRVEGGSLIYRTQDVRDMINCLTAIDDPADEVAVVAALRSPAFACSDVELARFKAGNGRFNYRHDRGEIPSGRVADALATLKEYNARRHDLSLAALVETFSAERGLVATGILDQADRNAFRRVRFIADQARAFEAAGPESLRAFVTWLERQAGAQMVFSEGAGVDDDEDAVRILTVHGAKGLEFPVVFLAGLAAQPNKGSYPTFMRDYHGNRVAIRLGRSGGNRLFTLGEYDTLAERNRAHEEAEFSRLLYVAATRARDHLVVSLYHGKFNSQSAAHLLIENGAQEHAPELTVHAATQARAVIPFEGLTVDPPADDVTPESFLDSRQALVAGSLKRRFTSATAIKSADAAELADNEAERTDETEPWSRGRAGTRVGRAVHAAIQSLPLDATDGDISSFARAQAVAEAVPDRARDVERLVRWVLRESTAWRRAMIAPRAMREVPFALQIDGKVLEGFIDLVIQTPHGIEIVDWKTDQISAGQVDARLDDYRLQAGLYVYGLEQATNQRVTRVTYVFASPQIERTVGDPAALALSARERLVYA